MGKIDEKRELIGILKVYMSLTVAVIVAVGAGISKLYLNDQINDLFWLGLIFVLILSIVFAFIAYKAHKEIETLRDLRD